MQVSGRASPVSSDGDVAFLGGVGAGGRNVREALILSLPGSFLFGRAESAAHGRFSPRARGAGTVRFPFWRADRHGSAQSPRDETGRDEHGDVASSSPCVVLLLDQV